MALLASDAMLLERSGVPMRTTGADVAALASGVHAIAAPASGSYVSPLLNGSALTTVAGAANRLDFIPFYPARQLVVNQMDVEVTTLLAASLAHIGLYASTAANLPGALIAGTVTALDCATVGLKTLALTQTLQPGTLYWLAVLTSSTQTLRAMPVAALMPAGAASAGVNPTVQRATFPFALLPATAPAVTATNAIAPLVRLRVA